MEDAARSAFEERYAQHWPDLLTLLRGIYPDRPDLDLHLSRLMRTCAEAWASRSERLKSRDRLCQANPTWFVESKWIGATLYVDLFAGDFAGLIS